METLHSIDPLDFVEKEYLKKLNEMVKWDDLTHDRVRQLIFELLADCEAVFNKENERLRKLVLNMWGTYVGMKLKATPEEIAEQYEKFRNTHNV